MWRWRLHTKRRRFAAGTREGWRASALRLATVDVRTQEAVEEPCAAAAAAPLPDTVCSGWRAGPCRPTQRCRLSGTPSRGCTSAAVGCSGSAGIWFFSWAHEPSLARQEREARIRDFRGRALWGCASARSASASGAPPTKCGRATVLGTGWRPHSPKAGDLTVGGDFGGRAADARRAPLFGVGGDRCEALRQLPVYVLGSEPTKPRFFTILWLAM